MNAVSIKNRTDRKSLPDSMSGRLFRMARRYHRNPDSLSLQQRCHKLCKCPEKLRGRLFVTDRLGSDFPALF